MIVATSKLLVCPLFVREIITETLNKGLANVAVLKVIMTEEIDVILKKTSVDEKAVEIAQDQHQANKISAGSLEDLV